MRLKEILDKGELLAEKSSWHSLVLPSWEKSIVNLAASVYSSFGAKVKAAPLKYMNNSFFANYSRIILLIIDALGYYQLINYGKKELKNLLETGGELFPLTSVAPTSTATALSSVFSARYPGEHGVLGYRLWIKSTGSIIRTLDMSPASADYSNLLASSPYLPKYFRLTTPFSQLTVKGIKVYSILPSHVTSHIFSKLTCKGAKTLSYYTIGGFAENIVQKLKKEEGFIILGYIDVLDKDLHVFSPNSLAYKMDLEMVLKTLKNIADLAKKVGDTILVVIADHGGIKVSAQNIVRLDKIRRIVRRLKIPPWGESRFAYIKGENSLKEEFNKLGFRVITADTARKMKIFGPTLRYPDRIGDFIVIPEDSRCIIYPYRTKELDFELKGHHGGLLKEEVIVPLILFS